MIRSTFSGFTSAHLALSASQKALDVTGQNLGNINTPGYTRQRLDLASIGPSGGSYSSSPSDCKVGMGVLMTGISQVRDPFLDSQFRSQLSKVGTVDAKDQILSEIGNIFDESDSAAVRDALNNLVSQLTEMSKNENIGSGGTDTLVRSATEVLINAIHQNATDIQGVQDNLIKKLEDSIMPDINECLRAITELNKSIKSSQVLGNPALELMDQRNALLDDLSTYLPIEVSYEDQMIGGGMRVDALNVTFRDSNGVLHTLISDDKSASMSVATAAGTVIPVSLKITDALSPGGPNPDIDIADALGDGILKGNLDMLNKSEIFDGSNVKGIGYYSKKFDTFVSTFATMMNEMNSTMENGVVVEHPLFTTKDGATTGFTAENIKVSDAWMRGDVQLTASKDTPPGGTGATTANENILKMINAISTDKHVFEHTVIKNGVSTKIKVFTGTMFESYDSIQNTQAIEKKASSSILKNHVSVLNQIADTKDSVSGVYLNEEVMNMMRYQQSYNAAAKLMTTMDDLLTTLINIAR